MPFLGFKPTPDSRLTALTQHNVGLVDIDFICKEEEAIPLRKDSSPL
ncbi:MAG: hypothetical protein QW596_00800 [Sulfolobales archaeon]